MAKSSETFNKKEKEKNRAKKQQSKREKAEARKASSSKGKGLEDMMAYIDEDGNITSTPPVAQGKRSVEAGGIAISTPKQVNEPQSEKQGIITFFNAAKGFGFIKESRNQENVFFHINNLTYPAKENDKVSFLTEKGPRGLNAINISKAK